MGDHDVPISFDLDSDGFISQECPSCARRFKVQYTKGDEKGSGPLGHCPYCGYMGKNCWWTTEQAQYIEDSAIAPLHDELARIVRDSQRGSSSKLTRINVNRTGDPARPTKPFEPNDPMPIIRFVCHNEAVKHDGSKNELRCVICGKLQKADE